MSEGQPPVVRPVVAVILVVMVLSGAGSGLDLSRDRPSLGGGNATVTVLEPNGDAIRVTPGRFGTNVSYVRIPDLAVDVERVTGHPRVFYQVEIPALGVAKQNAGLVRSTGRLTVPLSDRAIEPSTPVGNATARLTVRVQSFDGGYVVLNRTVPVRRKGGDGG